MAKGVHIHKLPKRERERDKKKQYVRSHTKEKTLSSKLTNTNRKHVNTHT